MAPPRPRPRPPPALMEELVEEILLRIPPAEPAHLFRAALVCKPWHRVLSDPGFLRRYGALHRAPPLLGYLHNSYRGNADLVPTAASSPLSPLPTFDCSEISISWVQDCRHGRVLFKCGDQLIVWDPITGDQKKLSVPNFLHAYSAAAVLCAVDGCDHLDCHAGAFLVVYCGTNANLVIDKPYETWATVYSSATREWSALISIGANHYVGARHTRLIRDALYFSHEYGANNMLRYDLGRHELSVISSPDDVPRNAVAMELDDGGLGFVAALGNFIYTWSWEADANNGGIGSWAHHMVMDLETVLPRGNPFFPHEVVGFVERTDTVFINVDAGLFTLDLKSRKVKKIGKRVGCCWIIPYVSFYTPDRGRFSSRVSGEAC